MPAIFADAIKEFWIGRDAQAADQARRGAQDTGTRGSVTAGKHMDGFAKKLTRLMIDAGVEEKSIFYRTKAYLPGYFRASKQWDVVVMRDDKLLAAIELKSHVGSFGNNFNNRTEEVLGSSIDFWTAYREAVLLASPEPWLGYLVVVELNDNSTSPVSLRGREPHFQVMAEFRGTSYVDRYELMCRRLVRERRYHAACLLTAARQTASDEENYSEPAEDIGAVQFVDQLIRRVAGG